MPLHNYISGLTWDEAKIRCPSGIYPACHNAKNTVTISGPAEDVDKFVKQLKNEGIFARTVKSAGVAFHSVYVQTVGDSYNAELEKVSVLEPIALKAIFIIIMSYYTFWQPPIFLCSGTFTYNFVRLDFSYVFLKKRKTKMFNQIFPI